MKLDKSRIAAVHRSFNRIRHVALMCTRNPHLIRRSFGPYTQGEVTLQSLWSRYDRHFVSITRYNALS